MEGEEGSALSLTDCRVHGSGLRVAPLISGPLGPPPLDSITSLVCISLSPIVALRRLNMRVKFLTHAEHRF